LTGLKHKGSEAVQELAASVAAIGKKWAQLKKQNPDKFLRIAEKYPEIRRYV
jgi:hypothetical protein